MKRYFLLPRCSRMQALNSSPFLSLQASRAFSRFACPSFTLASHLAGSCDCAHICLRMQALCSAPLADSHALAAFSCAARILVRRSSHALGSLACEQSKRALRGAFAASPCGAWANRLVEAASSRPANSVLSMDGPFLEGD